MDRLAQLARWKSRSRTVSPHNPVSVPSQNAEQEKTLDISKYLENVTFEMGSFQTLAANGEVRDGKASGQVFMTLGSNQGFPNQSSEGVKLGDWNYSSQGIVYTILTKVDDIKVAQDIRHNFPEKGGKLFEKNYNHSAAVILLGDNKVFIFGGLFKDGARMAIGAYTSSHLFIQFSDTETARGFFDKLPQANQNSTPEERQENAETLKQAALYMCKGDEKSTKLIGSFFAEGLEIYAKTEATFGNNFKPRLGR
jgi:hypothetical protein